MSLRARLILLVLGLAVTLVGGLGLYLGGSLRMWSREALDSELEQQALALTRSAKWEHGELELEAHELDGRALRWPYRIETPRGELLTQAGAFDWPPLSPESEAAVQTVRSSRVYSMFFRPEHGHGLRWVVRVAAPLGSFTAIEQRFRAGLIVALALTALLSGVGAAVVATLFLRPLSRLSREVAGLDPSVLDRRLTQKGLDPELGRLAGAFNGVLERIQRAFEMQRAFVARASHSLRTPVASILSMAEVALRRDRSAGEYRAALEEIALSARESARLAEGLLALSRVEQHAMRRAPERIEVAELFAELTRLFHVQADQAGVSLEARDDTNAAVTADRAILRELLHALVDNAIRYTPSGGRVVLRAFAAGDATVIEVSDTGLGIRPEEREKIFDPFFRGSAAEALQRSGSGLGLALVKALADAEGVGLELGDAPGGGTRVSLRLDAARAQNSFTTDAWMHRQSKEGRS